MEAIILAGGLGTRLKSVVKDLPKPMAPIKNLPFLHYLFEWLSLYPVSKVVMSVGYKANLIEQYFKNRYKNIEVDYAYEDRPLGTGGGIKNALTKTLNNDVLVVNGDTFFPIDINSFEDFHISNNADISIALKNMTNFDRYGSIEIENHTILNFNEKKYLSKGLINGGIYFLNKKKLNIPSLPDVFSFEHEILEKKVRDGSAEIKGKIFYETFIDIGVPEDYQKANEIL
ncbi:MAG TPA: nucleotidyltransferase family protein [Mucilaginibacter sp.]|jgi:D-glycero-alpha-D-manno-heptose 1-phosphate guanylyltransferase